MNFLLIPVEDEIWQQATDCGPNAPDRAKMLCKIGESFRLPVGSKLPVLMLKQRFGAIVETVTQETETHPALTWNQDTAVMTIQQVRCE